MLKKKGKKFLIRHKPFAAFDSSIGKLCLITLCAGDQIKLLESLEQSLELCPAEVFVRKLMVYICYPEESLDSEGYKPESMILSDDDIEKLSTEEIEKFAEIYIKHEDYLYRKTLTKKRTDEDGKEVIYFENGEIEHPRNDNETFVQYLHRLYVLQEKKMKEQLSKMTKSIIGTARFSAGLSQNIKNTLSMGNSISKALGCIGGLSAKDSILKSMTDFKTAQPLATPKLTRPNIDFGEIVRLSEENRRAPFDDLANRLDQLIEINTQSTEFMVEMNKTQTGIAGEIKASGESASNFSKWNIVFTVLVIVLTGFGLWLTVVDHADTNANSETIKEYVDNVVGKLDNINNSIGVNNQKSIEQLQIIFNKFQQTLIDQSSEFDSIITKQAQIIEQLKQQNTEANHEIDFLKKRLATMEAKLNIENKTEGTALDTK
ncbi:MAG: hypothetical protein ABIG61_05360 [Planctomycetota bacterium]